MPGDLYSISFNLDTFREDSLLLQSLDMITFIPTEDNLFLVSSFFAFD